jgi:hypothetical protein
MWVGRYAVPHHQHYTNHTDDHTAPRQTASNDEQTQPNHTDKDRQRNPRQTRRQAPRPA